ncbi:MAG: TIM barrel protein [Oscillospiraceae bacterium]
MYPKIYLAIDICFASKRWTEPGEWLSIAGELGLRYVEASADTECDFLYTPPNYRAEWAKKVRAASGETGVNVKQLYSGHGTYATLGLCHPDRRIRRHMLENWLYPMCDLAGELGANIGFFCHALPQETLQSPSAYRRAMRELYDALAQVADYGGSRGIGTAGVELMYSPHQPPWTLEGAAELLREVNARSRHPFYVTVDVGHQVGQSRFLRPPTEQLREAVAVCRRDSVAPLPWLGPDSALNAFWKAVDDPAREEKHLADVAAAQDDCSYLFATEQDSDTTAWLEQFGCYSPIIHLQQTDGFSSRHLPFTEEQNRGGRVRGEDVLRALRASYEREQEPGMPPRVDDIYLTLELFSGTADRPDEILTRLRESVAYWRQFVPEDGLSLDRLTKIEE